MHPIAKILFGLILLVGSAWWIWQGSLQYINRSGLGDLMTVLNGLIPPLVFIVGLFIIWLEWDEIKVEKELVREEKKTRHRR